MGRQSSPLGGLQDRHRVLTVETQATFQCTLAVVAGYPLGISMLVVAVEQQPDAVYTVYHSSREALGLCCYMQVVNMTQNLVNMTSQHDWSARGWPT